MQKRSMGAKHRELPKRATPKGYSLSIAQDEVSIREFIEDIHSNVLYIEGASFQQWIKYPHLIRSIVRATYDGIPGACAILLNKPDINGYTYGAYVKKELRHLGIGTAMTHLMLEYYDCPLYICKCLGNADFWDSLGFPISSLDRWPLHVIMRETFPAEPILPRK